MVRFPSGCKCYSRKLSSTYNFLEVRTSEQEARLLGEGGVTLEEEEEVSAGTGQNTPRHLRAERRKRRRNNNRSL